MAVLSPTQLRSVRNACERKLVLTYTKPLVNAAAQAVEDWLVANAGSVSSAINGATSPFVFTPLQKKKIVAEVLRLKFEADS